MLPMVMTDSHGSINGIRKMKIPRSKTMEMHGFIPCVPSASYHNTQMLLSVPLITFFYHGGTKPQLNSLCSY